MACRGTAAFIFLLAWGTLSPGAAGPARTQPAAQAGIVVRVDPRVELISIIFRLAGNREYTEGKVPSYLADIDGQLGPFKDHGVVKLARRLHAQRAVAFDAPMSLAVHLTNAGELEARVPLDPWPTNLDRRWRPADVREFLALARDFSRRGDFAGFVRKHQGLYDRTSERMRQLLARDAHLEWFEQFYGTGPAIPFSVYLGLVNGGCCYGTNFVSDGRSEAYCILGVWELDEEGDPRFPRSVLRGVIHEFNHSFCNPLVFAHREQLRRAGEKLYAPRAKEMQQQAYGHWHEMLQETLVRACVVRYLARYEGHLAASQETASQYSQGFIWTGPLAELLAGYERQRQEYRTLADFMPKVVDFFNAQAAAEEPTTYPATRPVGPGADAATGARKVSAWPYAAGGGDAAGAVGFGRSSSSPRRCCWQLWCPFG